MWRHTPGYISQSFVIALHPTLSLVILRAFLVLELLLSNLLELLFELILLLDITMADETPKKTMRLHYPNQTKPHEATVAVSPRPDEATRNVWRLRHQIRQLPLLVRLQILFWWLTSPDNLTIFKFEYCEEVSVLFYFLFLSTIFVLYVFFFFSSCTSQKTCLSLRGSI